MLTVPTRIILFETEASLKDELQSRLSCIGFAGDMTEAASQRQLRSIILEEKPSVIVCDLRSREDGVRQMLSEHFDHRTFFCIFIVDRSSEHGSELVGNDRFHYLEASYDLAEIVISIVDACFILALFAAKIHLMNVNCDEVRVTVKELLLSFGMSERTKGFGYLTEAVCEVVNDQRLESMITKNLYVLIAKRFAASPGAVERAIRTLVKGCWKNDKKRSEILKVFNDVSFSHSSPSNSEFILSTAGIIRKQLKFAAAEPRESEAAKEASSVREENHGEACDDIN